MDELITVDVFGVAYEGLKAPRFLTHTKNTSTGSALCNRVKPEHLMDYSEQAEPQDPPTCPVCLKRDPRFSK